MSQILKEQLEYSKALSKMEDWNYTTYFRLHYKVKPHIGDKIIEKMVSRSNVINSVWYTVENDVDIKIDNYTSIKKINHLHLLINAKKRIVNSNGLDWFKEYFYKALNIRVTDKGDIQSIIGKSRISCYINKYLGSEHSHHNYFSNYNNI